MEYDTDRGGGFEPLALAEGSGAPSSGWLPARLGTLESKDALKRRIGEAARFTDLDRLCLSPQCGFASTEKGNILAEDEQWAKLRLIVETAVEIWG